MKLKNLYIMAAAAIIGFTSCENYDNFDAPNAMLSGQVQFNGDPVGIRNNGSRFELWQDGYPIRRSIEVFIAQDGTYSASLFSGQYKMVRIAGAPWEAQLQDTMIVDVNGATEFDVPVTPFYVVNNDSYTVQGNTMTASFAIDNIVEGANLNEVNVYFGTRYLTDNNYNAAVQSLDVSQINLGEQNSFEVTIPEGLMDDEYVFMRIGVRSSYSNEFYFTQVQQVDL